MKFTRILIGLSMLSMGLMPCEGVENIDRGLVALEKEDGTVFVGWRLFKGEAPQKKFHIKCRSHENDQTVTYSSDGSTNAIIKPTAEGKQTISLIDGETQEELGTTQVNVDGEVKSYISIPFEGDYTAQKVGVADLDGDGEYEYVIKQPNFNTDPYQQPGYWKPSTTTYKLEAYKQDGTLMWRYDMGWAIEAGIWYSPWIVYDVDQDGRAEVYCKAGEGDPRESEGHVKSGPEYLVKIDGKTGEVLDKTDWIPRDDYSSYNYYSRNFLTVAYLDGKTPSLIVQRGTYRLIQTMALDKDFNQQWFWKADMDNEKYRGQGAHGLTTADVDLDGRDELVIGAAVIDEKGENYWTLNMGHPDVFYVADIDPDNPGLEIFYGFETRQETDGICLVDAKTGEKLWAHKEATHHIHGQGMIGDLMEEYPGIEVFAGERDYDKRWLYSAKGELIEFIESGSVTRRCLWWDEDPQKEIVEGGAIREWKGDEHQKIQGRIIGIADCLGDHREELLTSLDGELRIYTTTIPTTDSHPCLMQNHQYRLGVVAQTMGYFYPAQLGIEP